MRRFYIPGFLKLLLRPVNPSSILIQGLFSVCIGLWLCMPWDAYMSSPPYTFLGVLPDWYLGVFLLVIGAILVRGAYINSAKAIILVSWIGFMAWTLITVLVFFGDPSGVGWILCSVIGFHCAYIALNVKQNHGVMPLSDKRSFDS